MPSITQAVLLALMTGVPTLAHNYVVCTNAVNIPLDDLVGDGDRQDPALRGNCSGYPRAWPADGTPQGDNRNEQAWPWQNIWPLTDNAALRNHRVCNWNQENPTYAPGYGVAKVKPGSTLMMQIQTNNHVHEYATRPSGHYKIFLAGPSGTQLTTANQLTFDRVIFSAPSNKYAHVVGEPVHAGYSGDPGLAFLPVKMVDPTGAYLPDGTYNFVWAYFWATSEAPQKDFMIPDYSTSFDVVIDSSSKDAGSLTECVSTNPDCATYLVGKSSSPGAKDTTSPWPPYSGNYLFTNFDGDDPSSDNGQRTFQPYWKEFVPASDAPAISEVEPFDIKSKNEDDLLTPIPIAGGGTDFPGGLDQYPNMPAGGGESIPVTQTLKPMSIDGSTAQGGGTGSGSGSGSGMGGSMNGTVTTSSNTTDTTGSDTTGSDTTGSDTTGSGMDDTSSSTSTSVAASGTPTSDSTTDTTDTQKKARRRSGSGRHRRVGHAADFMS